MQSYILLINLLITGQSVMGAPKKTAGRVSDDPDELTSVPLKAILLADSFTTKFRPITLERPKVWALLFLQSLVVPWIEGQCTLYSELNFPVA